MLNRLKSAELSACRILLKKSGCKMVEVGTTNKTYASDYQNAVSSKSGLLLKVHTSNYKVVGFVQDVSIKELAEVKTATGLPFYYDLGGGALKNLTEYGLPYEPLVQDALKDKFNLVSSPVIVLLSAVRHHCR